MYKAIMIDNSINIIEVYNQILKFRETEDELSFIDVKLSLMRDKLETSDNNLLEEFEKLVNRADELLEEIDRINEWMEVNGIEVKKIG